MPIAYPDPDGGTLVAHLAPGITARQAARAMRLAPGTWREITAEEAAILQRPTEAEKIKARRAEKLRAEPAGSKKVTRA